MRLIPLVSAAFLVHIPMKLFKYEGYQVVVSEEALLLKPFRDVYDKDPNDDKSGAMKELAYVYFMCDPRSDYQYIVDDEERHAAVIEGEGFAKSWKPNAKVLRAMEFYKSFKPMSALLLEDTRFAVDKLRRLLRDIDLSKVDDKGKPLYTLNTITSTIKQIPQLVKDLDEAEKAIESEMKTSGKMRGSGAKTIFEDGIDVDYD